MPIASPVETISPELALVDDELNARGRQVLCDFPHRIASPMPGAKAERARRPLPLARAAAALLVTLTLGSLSAGAPQAREAVRAAPTRTHAPKTEAVRETRLLRWRSVSGAVLYNVILWRDGKRVLDLWPRTAAVRLPMRRLTSGAYQWFVYPVREARGKQQFGRLAASGTIRI